MSLLQVLALTLSPAHPCTFNLVSAGWFCFLLKLPVSLTICRRVPRDLYCVGVIARQIDQIWIILTPTPFDFAQIPQCCYLI